MIRSARRRGLATAVASALAVLSAGCIDYLESGEIGQARFFTQVRGAVPLRMVAPISDRDGNIYALFGSSDVAEAKAFVGHAGGGWSGGCAIHEGTDRGLHGFVGTTQDRAWYWSGDALVEIKGNNGSCRNVLDTDPTTGVDLAFLGVIPDVEDAPSRATTVAMVQSPSDPVPFVALIDLDLRRYANLEVFEPASAREVAVLGTGYDPGSETGVMVVRYRVGDEERREARFYTREGQPDGIVALAGLGTAEEDAIVGNLQYSESDGGLGLLDDGRLLTFGRGGGGVSDPPASIDAVLGVHRRDGGIWLVGAANGRPVAARFENGAVGNPQVWSASERAAQSLAGGIEVLDDRAQPVRFVTWTAPQAALGPAPFLSAHTPDHYAQDETLLLIAGPSISGAIDTFTFVAVAPVGIDYP